MMSSYKTFLLLTIFLSFLMNSQTLAHSPEKAFILTDSVNKSSLGKYLYYFRDHSKNLTFEDVVSGRYDSLFQLSTKDIPNFGNLDATYWNKFTVINQSSKDINWLILVDEHHLDTIEFYYPGPEGNYQCIKSGRWHPFDQRNYKHNNYVLDFSIQPADTAVFYLQITSHVMIYSVYMMKYETFVNESSSRHLAKGIIIGLFLMIILYNFFIYLAVSDKNYLYYTLYACFNILMICDLTGYMDFLWQGNLQFMWDKTPAIIAVDGLLLMLFSKHILEFDKYFPFANKFIYYFLAPVAIWTITVNFLGYKIYASMTNQFWVLILVVFLYIAAIKVYRKGYLPARFYIIACGSFFIACGMYAATLLGFIPVNTLTNHIIEIGSGLEMLLFSFALADKMRQFRKDKSQAQSQLLKTLRENERLILDQNRILEIQVEERTKDLKLEKEKSENLLLNILPKNIADELKEKGFSEAKHFGNVSIMFIEFVEFSKISENFGPEKLVSEINYYFKGFDQIINKYQLEKIKSFGGAYLAVSGMSNPLDENAVTLVKASIEILNFVREYKIKGGAFEIKIGIHSGPVVAGIVGSKKFAFDVWGDVVNTAARMEQHGEADNINVSLESYHKIKNTFDCRHRGKISIKNKGEYDMYIVENYKLAAN